MDGEESKPRARYSRRVAWSKAEDTRLKEIMAGIETRGETCSWVHVSQLMAPQFRRNSKQCRGRWFSYLNPTIRKGGWSPDEDSALFVLQAQLGNHWTRISRSIPGRSADDVKNRFVSLSARQKAERQAYEDAAAAVAAARSTAPDHESDVAPLEGGGDTSPSERHRKRSQMSTADSKQESAAKRRYMPYRGVAQPFDTYQLMYIPNLRSALESVRDLGGLKHNSEPVPRAELRVYLPVQDEGGDLAGDPTSRPHTSITPSLTPSTTLSTVSTKLNPLPAPRPSTSTGSTSRSSETTPTGKSAMTRRTSVRSASFTGIPIPGAPAPAPDLVPAHAPAHAPAPAPAPLPAPPAPSFQMAPRFFREEGLVHGADTMLRPPIPAPSGTPAPWGGYAYPYKSSLVYPGQPSDGSRPSEQTYYGLASSHMHGAYPYIPQQPPAMDPIALADLASLQRRRDVVGRDGGGGGGGAAAAAAPAYRRAPVPNWDPTLATTQAYRMPSGLPPHAMYPGMLRPR